ncbi:MAG: 16S rRNA (uracil(1498)-N(3))-methyltransferase [Candidatus Saccharimonadales bacterium]
MSESKKYSRLYAPGIKLTEDFWLHDKALLDRIRKLFADDRDVELVLFDGISQDRLYLVAELNEREAHLQLVTDMHRNLPEQEVYLMWDYLGTEEDYSVIARGVEAGASHFLPLVTEASSPKAFDIEHMQSAIIKTIEEGMRSDIPNLRAPLNASTAIMQLHEKVRLYSVKRQQNNQPIIEKSDISEDSSPVGIFVSFSNEPLTTDSIVTQLDPNMYGEIGIVGTNVVTELVQ